jgi:hypothetical protein
MTLTEALNDTAQAQKWHETVKRGNELADAQKAQPHDVYVPGGLANGADHVIWRAPNYEAAVAECERVASIGGPRYSVKLAPTA